MRKFFVKGKAHHYFIFIFILLLAVLAFYLSCNSKSPTDANATSNDALAAQGAQSTTQTTTSSSTTTSVKPGQSPTNTTTLITSRTLTSTSTRTSTTSPSTTSTATTSRKPTTTLSTTIPTTISTTVSTTIPITIPTTITTTISTTVPTTSVGVSNLECCQVTVTINDGLPIVVQEYDTISVSPEDVVKISISVKNSGTAPTLADALATYNSSPSSSFINVDDYENLRAIPADDTCYTRQNALQINVSSYASPGDLSDVNICIQDIYQDVNIYFMFRLSVRY